MTNTQTRSIDVNACAVFIAEIIEAQAENVEFDMVFSFQVPKGVASSYEQLDPTQRTQLQDRFRTELENRDLTLQNEWNIDSLEIARRR